MIFEYCAIAAVILFGILVFYVAKTLVAVQKTLEKIGPETQRLIQNSNSLTESFQGHVEAFSPLMLSISDLGNALQDAKSNWTESRIRAKKLEEKSPWTDKIRELIEFSALGLMAWDQIKKKKGR